MEKTGGKEKWKTLWEKDKMLVTESTVYHMTTFQKCEKLKQMKTVSEKVATLWGKEKLPVTSIFSILHTITNPQNCVVMG